jgi:glycosyltransferase involved in cell wall biosynthesis
MVDNFPEAAGKVEIIPNGIDSGLLQTNQWREPSEPSILYAGRLEKYKNVDMVMKAVAKLRHKYERLTFKIVGSGPFKDELKQLSHSLGVEKNVEWIPRLPQKELFPLYASSSIVVQASEAENWGNTVAEAIGVGAPTIVANASSLAEFAEAGLAHSVQTPIDEGRLASKIGEVLESPRKYSPLGIKSPLIISWEEVAEKTFSRYTDFHTAG